MLTSDEDLNKTEIVKANGILCIPPSTTLSSGCGQTVSDNQVYIHDNGRKLSNMGWVVNATFNNMSVILVRSDLLVISENNMTCKKV